MEFEEVLMKRMIGNDTQKPRVSHKHKWWISFHRASSPSKLQTPKEFSCPISGSLMADPVIVSSGHTFELACIQACKALAFTPTLPDGSAPDFATVIPNLALKSAIINWCQKHSINPPKPLDSPAAESIVRSLIASQKSKTHFEKEVSKSNTHFEKEVSNSEKELIQGVKDSPSLRFNHAVTELNRRPIHFHSSSEESFRMSDSNLFLPPLQLCSRPSCYSSASSSSEIESLNPESSSSEEEEFVTKLRSPQVFEIEETLISLRKITRTREESRVYLCTPRLLSALRSLISSKYTNVQVNSVAALVNLSLERANKVKIVRAGIVPPLIDLLKGGSSEAKEHASGALFSLALDDQNKTAIGVLGALQPLMHVLREGTERTRHDSALALYHLSLVQSNRTKLIKLGSIPVFLGMVKLDQLTGRVLLILGNMGSCREGRAALLDSGAVECLVGRLRDNELDASTRERCVAVLYGLSYGGLRFKGLAKAAGAVEEFIKVERSGSECAREKARRMLELMKGRSEEEEEEVDWEELLELGSMSKSRVRVGVGKDGSTANSSEF